MQDTPNTAVERALVSDRLDRLDDSVDALRGEVREGNTLLRRLVEQGDSRERREDLLAKAELDERQAQGAWLRSIVSRDVLLPLVTSVGAFLTGIGSAIGLWSMSAAAVPAITPAESHAPAQPPAPFEP